jgi:hypothetical protein
MWYPKSRWDASAAECATIPGFATYIKDLDKRRSASAGGGIRAALVPVGAEGTSRRTSNILGWQYTRQGRFGEPALPQAKHVQARTGAVSHGPAAHPLDDELLGALFDVPALCRGLCVNARFLSTECTLLLLLLLLAMVAVVVVRQREPASFSNSNVPLFSK